MKIDTLIKVAVGLATRMAGGLSSKLNAGGQTTGSNNPLGGLQQLIGSKGKSFMKEQMPMTTNFVKKNIGMFKNVNDKLAPAMQLGRTGSLNRPGSIGKTFGMGSNKANFVGAKGVNRSSNLTGFGTSNNKVKGSNFSSAFSDARKQGLSNFEFNGKKFNTQIKGQTKTNTTKQAPVKNAPIQQNTSNMSGVFSKRFGKLNTSSVTAPDPKLKKLNIK